ncbi:MAG: hypothetical protein JXB17_04805, partial [Bacteroidales bacterium]|nr:hypothetical protein [Bacteroidales bacterium]
IIDDEPASGVYYNEEIYQETAQSQNLQKLIHGPVFSVATIFKIGAKSSFVFDSMIGHFKYEKVNQDEEYVLNMGTKYTVTRKNAYATALFLMPGIRFQNTDRKAFQICVAGVSMFGDSDASFPIPMCSWLYKL